MTRPSPFPAPPDHAASVLPLRGSRTHAPSSVLVRARLEDGLDASRVRAVVALFAEVCDVARGSQEPDARWWSAPVRFRIEDVAHGAALSLPEAETALADLEAARLLVPVERGHRIEADALCECPALEGFDWEAARARLRDHDQLVGPATAVLREIVRAADREGGLRTTIPRLLDATLYGRTRLTQALAVLARTDLVRRSDLANRAVHLRLMGGAGSAAPPLPPSPAPPTRPAAASGGARMRLPTGAPIQIAGELLQLAPGIVPELELGPDGRYYLWLGPVRIGPYDL